MEEDTFKIVVRPESLDKNMKIFITLKNQQKQPTQALFFKKYFVKSDGKNIYRPYQELIAMQEPISLFLTDSEQDQTKENKQYVQFFSFSIDQIKEIRLMAPTGTYPFFKKMYEDSIQLKQTISIMQQQMQELKIVIKKQKKDKSIKQVSTRQIDFNE